jgi:dTDP-4-dehydrorhamnose reductase
MVDFTRPISADAGAASNVHEQRKSKEFRMAERRPVNRSLDLRKTMGSPPQVAANVI